jgi:hypothetical protein
LDDHAADSNHKKMLGMVSMLCKSNMTAVDMLEHAQSYYQNLTVEAGPIAVGKWKNDIEKAEEKRLFDIKAMDIYATRSDIDAPAYQPVATGTPSTALDHWMELSLAAEEKQ